MIVLLFTIALLIAALVKAILYATSLAVEKDKLAVDLFVSNELIKTYKNKLDYEVEYRNELLEKINTLKQKPYVVEKKPKIQVLNFEEIVNGYHKYYSFEDLKRIYCDKFKLHIPDHLINYKTEKTADNNIRVSAIIKMLEHLE